MLLQGVDTIMPKKSFHPESLAYLREKKGFTLKELSEKTGISINQLFSLEKGAAKTPRYKTIDLLSRALGVLPDYFYEDIDDFEYLYNRAKCVYVDKPEETIDLDNTLKKLASQNPSQNDVSIDDLATALKIVHKYMLNHNLSCQEIEQALQRFAAEKYFIQLSQIDEEENIDKEKNNF